MSHCGTTIQINIHLWGTGSDKESKISINCTQCHTCSTFTMDGALHPRIFSQLKLWTAIKLVPRSPTLRSYSISQISSKAKYSTPAKRRDISTNIIGTMVLMKHGHSDSSSWTPHSPIRLGSWWRSCSNSWGESIRWWSVAINQWPTLLSDHFWDI